MTGAYYNENDPKAAAWLSELIKGGHIADGEVDERSIADVDARDLGSFVQCHFFAGIGGWSHALRLAGWPDDRPVWTGSCPCQPFSVAGKGAGTSDERHLWPEFRRLIDERRPASVFGEQVASKAGRAWLATVRAEMEALGYAVGAADLGAAGVGAPHIRQRLWFYGTQGLADSNIARPQGRVGLPERPDERLAGPRSVEGRLEHGPSNGRLEGRAEPIGRGAASGCGESRLADASAIGHDRRRSGEASDEPGSVERPERLCDVGRMGISDCPGSQPGREAAEAPRHGGAVESAGRDGRTRPPHVDWSDADWLHCTDGKWRPVEPGTFPLANGVSGRVGLLRGYGNAIVPAVAAAFIEATQESNGALN